MTRLLSFVFFMVLITGANAQIHRVLTVTGTTPQRLSYFATILQGGSSANTAREKALANFIQEKIGEEISKLSVLGYAVTGTTTTTSTLPGPTVSNILINLYSTDVVGISYPNSGIDDSGVFRAVASRAQEPGETMIATQFLLKKADGSTYKRNFGLCWDACGNPTLYEFAIIQLTTPTVINPPVVNQPVVSPPAPAIVCIQISVDVMKNEEVRTLKNGDIITAVPGSAEIHILNNVSLPQDFKIVLMRDGVLVNNVRELALNKLKEGSHTVYLTNASGTMITCNPVTFTIYRKCVEGCDGQVRNSGVVVQDYYSQPLPPQQQQGNNTFVFAPGITLSGQGYQQQGYQYYQQQCLPGHPRNCGCMACHNQQTNYYYPQTQPQTQGPWHQAGQTFQVPANYYQNSNSSNGTGHFRQGK